MTGDIVEEAIGFVIEKWWKKWEKWWKNARKIDSFALYRGI